MLQFFFLTERQKYNFIFISNLLQLPLGLLFKNENLNEEMIDILQELHDKYLPVDKQKVDRDEVVSILEHLFIGGDQLTDERANNCKAARSDGNTKFERLEGHDELRPQKKFSTGDET